MSFTEKLLVLYPKFLLQQLLALLAMPRMTLVMIGAGSIVAGCALLCYRTVTRRHQARRRVEKRLIIDEMKRLTQVGRIGDVHQIAALAPALDELVHRIEAVGGLESFDALARRVSDIRMLIVQAQGRVKDVALNRLGDAMSRSVLIAKGATNGVGVDRLVKTVDDDTVVDGRVIERVDADKDGITEVSDLEIDDDCPTIPIDRKDLVLMAEVRKGLDELRPPPYVGATMTEKSDVFFIDEDPRPIVEAESRCEGVTLFDVTHTHGDVAVTSASNDDIN